MKLKRIPEGNGQQVYIDPEWLKATDEQYGYFYIPDEVETPGKKERKEVVDYLLQQGYDVITDSSKVTEDTFCFSPCCDKHINKNVEEYVKKKEEKIHASLEMTNVHEPLTLNFPSEVFPTVIPNLPFILKNEKMHGGIDKVLIQTPEQLEKFKTFYEEINEYSFQEAVKNAKKQWGLGDDVVFNKDGKSNSPVSFCPIDYKERLKEEFVMQEFIETPTEYSTSLRVVTSSSGDILCASLKYAKPSKENQETKIGLVDRYLSNPESLFYLGSENIISNTVAGGKSILIGKTNYEEIERVILEAHGIDPNTSELPPDVVEAALKIAQNVHREIGAISGIDFILDKKTKKWKYLEQQEYPMMYTYCEKYNMPYETDYHNYDRFLETGRRADIDARLRALALTMEKKNKFTSLKDEELKR